MINEKITYSKAFDELQAIVSEIEEGEISLDDLSEKLNRAAYLIKICKKKLSTTEKDVNEILRDLESMETESFEEDE